MNEIWKDIDGYNGDYQISNLGKVKCLKFNKIRMVKATLSGNSNRPLQKGLYYTVKLNKKGNVKNMRVHRLIALHFIEKIVGKNFVNHIDGDRLNNCVKNLEWCTCRENTIHSYSLKKTSSKYCGVCWDKSRKKWVAQITINSKNKFLGRFDIEEEASYAYEVALKSLNNYE